MKQSRLFPPKYSGLLRGACHRARVRATRWLAMTEKLFEYRIETHPVIPGRAQREPGIHHPRLWL